MELNTNISQQKSFKKKILNKFKANLVIDLPKQQFDQSEPDQTNDFQEIINGIYLGNYISAQSWDKIKKEGITNIINCSPQNCPNLFQADIQYLNVNIIDDWSQDLFLVIQLIIDYITTIRNQQGKVLVHCYQGISRGPSIVIAYLIYTMHINDEQALQLIQNKYQAASPNVDFMIQLKNFAQKIQHSQNTSEEIPEKIIEKQENYSSSSILQISGRSSSVSTKMEDNSAQTSPNTEVKSCQSIQQDEQPENQVKPPFILKYTKTEQQTSASDKEEVSQQQIEWHPLTIEFNNEANQYKSINNSSMFYQFCNGQKFFTQAKQPCCNILN
eukprot:TRINITY_DN11702_c0_g1_i1.p1 TRINITY_DN11702_c0_g1~~TRINITY_DN11702_c0_g1_i1.p1  ORF type:complete len:329 (+),score=41.92 TRINITY_DN11702_c0_g1_i1:46-1032(+)